MQKVETILIDDIGGEAADDTVTFGLDRTGYEIDLTKERATELLDILWGYAAKGRRVTGNKVKPQSSWSKHTAADRAAERERLQKVRTWLLDNGYTPADRGRISATHLQAYRDGTPAPAFSG